MKRLSTFLFTVLLVGMQHAIAQQVSTLYFLENAPMRHLINPALQPTGDGFVNFTPLGYTNLWVGNNSLSMSDAIYNSNGTTITALHPDADRQQLMKQIKNLTIEDQDMMISLLNLGIRHNKFGYILIGLNQRVDAGLGIPKGLYDFTLNGGMTNLEGVSSINLSNMCLSVNAYTELSGGYSYELNEKWTIGGKLKVLLGQASTRLYFTDLSLDASANQWTLHGVGSLQASAPLNWSALPKRLDYETIKQIDINKLQEGQSLVSYLIPQGYGAAIDFGFSYRPHQQVQITAAINDLGLMYWKGVNYKVVADTTYSGVKNLQYSDYANKGNNYQFDGNKLWKDVQTELQGLAKAPHTEDVNYQYWRMLTAKLNVGVDVNFVNNKLGLGVVSNMRYYYNQFVAEVTFGGAIRPCKWFNMAVSYSLLNNGKYSNIGAGISLMPYDGINLTLAMDYIPTVYAQYENIPLPYHAKGMNIALGFSIVWGTNKAYDHKDLALLREYENGPTEAAHVKKESLMNKRDVYDYQDAQLTQERQDTVRVVMDEDTHDLLRDAVYSIKFSNKSATLTTQAEGVLSDIARALINHPDYHVAIYVYTDNQDNQENSLNLSNKRASKLVMMLAKKGISPTRMKAYGKGQEAPIASNLIPEGRELNNRVIFYIY